ncbi:MAG: hypothetical protein ABI585_06750 [Betaproteobacteria bacterium]
MVAPRFFRRLAALALVACGLPGAHAASDPEKPVRSTAASR